MQSIQIIFFFCFRTHLLMCNRNIIKWHIIKMYTLISFDTCETTITMKKMSNTHHPPQFPYFNCVLLCPTFQHLQAIIVLLPATTGQFTLSQVYIESQYILFQILSLNETALRFFNIVSINSSLLFIAISWYKDSQFVYSFS